jgi:hypothetical protein
MQVVGGIGYTNVLPLERTQARRVIETWAIG